MPLAFVVAIFSCEQKNVPIPQTSLSEQVLEFEIYDSLTADLLGDFHLMDISPDGKYFLLIDQHTDTLIILSESGAVRSRFLRKGEAPGDYKGNRISDGKFISNEQFFLPATDGINQYSLDGDFQKKYKPEFLSLPSLLVPNSKKLYLTNNRAFAFYPGRGAEQWGDRGIEFQKKHTALRGI